MRVSRRVLFVAIVAALSTVSQPGTFAQLPASLPTLRVQATSVEDLRTWDAYVTQQERAGSLRVRTSRQDPDLPSRVVERLDQFHQGVPIWGADIVRSSERGVPIAMFGVLAPDLTLNVEPTLDVENASGILMQIAGANAGFLTRPELVIAPLLDGSYRLAYAAVLSNEFGVWRIFIDANNGTWLSQISELQGQQAVGSGRGVLNDLKKLSVDGAGGNYVAYDRHRAPEMITFDLAGNFLRMSLLDDRRLAYSVTDFARDADNNWTDPAVVDAHAHAGLTYDYFYKRFGRSGLDGRNAPMYIVVNAAHQTSLAGLPASVVAAYGQNANWCGPCGPGGFGRAFMGSGLPPGRLDSRGRSWTHLSGSLDAVAHELTHGLTEYTSGLVYSLDSGALNEAFSDIMGKGAEFFFRARGSALGQADYVIGKDVVRGVSAGAPNGIRSMENPRAFDHPDHYAIYQNLTNDTDGDYGGVHINSGIANHAFYLAVEGGTNRTSAVTVTGVGSANREQIEKAFFRAFTLLMPRSAGFITARAATVTAARDLYGANSAAERAVSQGWSAVGVPDTNSVRVTGPGQLGAGRDWSTSVRVASSSARFIYQANLDGFDPTKTDLDLYLTSSSGCAYWTRPVPSCVLVKSDSPKAFETVAMFVSPGQLFYIYVANFSGQTANPRLTDFYSPTGVTLGSTEPSAASILTKPSGGSQP